MYTANQDTEYSYIK